MTTKASFSSIRTAQDEPFFKKAYRIAFLQLRTPDRIFSVVPSSFPIMPTEVEPIIASPSTIVDNGATKRNDVENDSTDGTRKELGRILMLNTSHGRRASGSHPSLTRWFQDSPRPLRSSPRPKISRGERCVTSNARTSDTAGDYFGEFAEYRTEDGKLSLWPKSQSKSAAASRSATPVSSPPGTPSRPGSPAAIITNRRVGGRRNSGATLEKQDARHP